MASGILSGNRNFEGRVHPNTRANYLASPPLVIAYAIAGTVRIDFEKEPVGEKRERQSCMELSNSDTMGKHSNMGGNAVTRSNREGKTSSKTSTRDWT